MIEEKFLTEPPADACTNCKDEGWVCENHPDHPWNEGDPSCCGGAGAPCACNKINPPWWYVPWWRRKATIQ